ncbi:MAG: PA14 domain-containing protein [Myxococcota bacterium]
MRMHVMAGLLMVAHLLGASATGMARTPDAVGGGWTDNGILGTYFSNPKLAGEPDFLRRDVRLDFHWGPGAPVGGSSNRDFANFPNQGFSIRWRGVLLPRHSEAYVLRGVAEGGLRIWIQPEGEEEQMLVNRWLEDGPFQSEALSLRRGQAIGVRIEYVQRKARGGLRLSWRSPSTPSEVIDPVVQQGVNAASYREMVWANALKSRRFWNPNKKEDALDALGYPTKDGVQLVLSESKGSDPHIRGRHRLSFEGRASVNHSCCCKSIVFEADDERRVNELPDGAYDPKTNRTSASFFAPCSRIFLVMDDLSDTPDDEAFVREMTVARPLFPGSEEAHRPDEVVHRLFSQIVRDHFTAIRWLAGANREGEDRWEDRSLPDHAKFHGSNGVENWEYLVMLANETGKDLMITTPIGADDAYFRNLALLLRYGSDGETPYTEPTPKARFPPLNSNLRVYIEVGNEIWNWIFPSTTKARALAIAAKNTDQWAIINHDDRLSDPGSIDSIRRWHALRTLRASQALRTVFGDEGMGHRFRPVIHYQYINHQRTAEASLDFLDTWLWHEARARGQRPVPVSHWIWGSGGASYYGVENKRGLDPEIVVDDASFETHALSSSRMRLGPIPSHAWTFKGAAGLARLEEDEPTGPIEKPPVPQDGLQVAMMMPGGSFSQNVEITKPGHYAIVFKAAGGGEEGWPRHLPFDVEVDGESVSPQRQEGVARSGGGFALQHYRNEVSRLRRVYGSSPFEVVKPGRHTIGFRAVETERKAWVLIDEVKLARAEAIVSSGFARGEATGQVGQDRLAERFNIQATFSRSFGLPVVAYEAGWSVGGDFDQVPLQTWTKFNLEEVGSLNDRMVDTWFESGSFMNVWGVYTFFSIFDPMGAAERPLMKSLIRTTRRLPAEVTHGQRLPVELGPGNADWTMGRSPSTWERLWGASGRRWWAWMLVAPQAGVYKLELKGSGSVRVEVDGEIVALNEDGRAKVFLTRGAHGLRAAPEPGAAFTSLGVRPN